MKNKKEEENQDEQHKKMESLIGKVLGNNSKNAEFVRKKLGDIMNGETPKPKDLRGTIADLGTSGFLEITLCALLKIEMKKGLQYSDKELRLIEEKINDMFEVGHEPMATTLIPFGYYLGELLIRKFPGSKWVVTDEVNKSNDIFEVYVEIAAGTGKAQVRPFIRVSKYWKNREDRMSSLVRMIELTSEIQMDPEYWSKRADEDGWIQLASGDAMRMFQTKKNKDTNITNVEAADAKGIFHDKTFGDGKRKK